MNNIILMGPPGVGKGTQAKILAKEFELLHISTGDLIRAEQAKETKIGKLATEFSDKGNFLPDIIVTTMVRQFIIDNPKANGFIFDGFPRTVDQAKALDDFLIHRKTPINKIILMEASDESITKRLLERAEKENRPDDTSEVISTRLKNYKDKTIPVIFYYNNSNLFINNRNVVTVHVNDLTIEEVTDVMISSVSIRPHLL